MPEMHLKQPGFTYRAYGPLKKNKERIQKFKEIGDTKYIYRNELDKACFQHDMTYGDSKDLATKTTSDKAFNIAKNPRYDGSKRGITSNIYKCFNKKSKDSGINNKIKQNEQLPEELHKTIIRKCLKRKVYSSFKGNIWCADLADMQLSNNFE